MTALEWYDIDGKRHAFKWYSNKRLCDGKHYELNPSDRKTDPLTDSSLNPKSKHICQYCHDLAFQWYGDW